ncbi:MAG: Crp/Fnr family transcriptional regulator, partial [Clostridia bacterium]|nr:Crp/Fnr family transcriptional regulator [Clostridia bacterium]
MKKYISILKQTKLFADVNEQEIESMLGCLQAKIFDYKKGEYVLNQGEHLHHVMLLVKGKLHIQSDDY